MSSLTDEQSVVGDPNLSMCIDFSITGFFVDKIWYFEVILDLEETVRGLPNDLQFSNR